MNYDFAPAPSYVAQSPAEIRAQFIRKVYGLFFLSLLVTCGVGAIFFQPGLAVDVLEMWLPMVLGVIVVGFAMRYAVRVQGLNTFLFFLFAGINGALLGSLMFLLTRIPQ